MFRKIGLSEKIIAFRFVAIDTCKRITTHTHTIRPFIANAIRTHTAHSVCMDDSMEWNENTLQAHMASAQMECIYNKLLCV